MRSVFRQLMMSSRTDWTGKPADWSDIRKDCPADSIALYAAHKANYTTEGYQQIGTAPYTLVGSPTITDGVMSGFTSEGYDGADNYAFIDAYPTETIKSFRIKIKFTVGTLPSSSQYYTLLGQKEGNYNCPQIDISSGVLSYRHPIGAGWGGGSITGVGVSANTTYWAIIDYNNLGKTKMLLSTDGVQYTAQGTGAAASLTWDKPMAIGADFDTALNEMSKSFGGGGSIDLNETSIEINNKAWFKYGSKITAVNNNNLYLQSSGTQYIDTGVIVSNDIGFDCDYETADDIATTNYGAIFGTRISSSSSNFQITSYSSDGSFLGSFRFGDNANSKSVGMIKNTRQQVSFRNLAFTNASGTTSTVNTYSWANGNPILLYAFNDNGTAVGGKATAKIYRQKFYDGNTLIRDFVPVKQGMVIGNFTVPANGMWDLVNQEYYPNFGTGTFTYGGEDTQYDDLSFKATCAGGYNVFIDGAQYGTTYASGATCTITWSNYTATAGDSITTPEALTAHKIWIEPTTSSHIITAFNMTDRAGLLWLHSNITTVFTSIANFVGSTTGTSLIKAVTAKGNVLKSKGMSQAFGKCPYLEYVPILDFDNSDVAITYLFYSPQTYNLKKVIIRNLKQTGSKGNSQAFVGCYGLEEIVLQNSDLCWYVTLFYKYLYSLKKLPKGLYNDIGNVYATDFSSLEPTDLDFRERTAAKYITINGDSTHFAGGIKSLRVSNEAPFDYATPPQINVSYTGMDRQALVQLFNDLPTVSAGQIINITGCTGSEDLTEEEVAIAEDKGWTITGGPQFADLYAYTDGSNNTIYSTDNLPTTSSELFNSTGTKLTGNPTAVSQGLINCTNYQNRLTITDGVASGFAQSNRIRIDDAFRPSNQPWSWVLKLKRSSPAYANRELILGNGTGYYQSGFGIGMEENNGIKKFGAGFSSNGNDWDIGWKWNDTETTTDVWFYVKSYFTGTQYGFAIKKEGDTAWTEATPTDSTTPIKDQGAYKTELGGHIANGAGAGSDYFRGEIDLKETYSEIDGVKTHYYTSIYPYRNL